MIFGLFDRWLATSEAAADHDADVVATRWWNALSPDQMVAALFGDDTTEEQEAAAKKM